MKMGKNKRNKKWRIFSFDDTKDETHINIGDVRLNDIDSQHNSSEIPQKYSQILGDHHTNYISSTISNRSSSFIHNSKTRNSYNNKENYYNQRSAAKNTKVAFGSQRSHKFPSTSSNSSLKDLSNKPDENESFERKKSDSTSNSTEPVKFNEDEYTRITTPRQDVLFKKGYLSRMNNTKTAPSSTVVSTTSTIDSSAPNSTITTNSDQESTVSLSTLSPATTPPMDYGQPDGLDFASPVYYPGYYYDENGILVISMYNGYNYYPNTPSATSPVYLMPYPYQFDPFFMAPNTEVPLSSEKTSTEEQRDDSVESNDKVESEADKINNLIAEEPNGARMSCEDAKSNSSKREETEIDEKEMKQEQTENVQTEQVPKQQCVPFYPNEFGYVYPTYSNGYYNGVYYYPNGMPSHRPSKLRRRKRFLSSRNSHPSRSTETTTDYSDDDVGNSYVHNKRYHAPRHNGWIYHHNNHYNYNQYHYNSKYRYDKMNVDKNANETSSHLNVNVQEFYPRVQSNDKEGQDEKEQQESKEDVPVKTNNDLQCQNVPKANKNEIQLKSKTSHTSKITNGRVSKKEIIEGIKLMEQQNINLMSTSKSQINSSNGKDDEWNVIKNGKKIKVSKETEDIISTDSNRQEEKTMKEFNEINKIIVEVAEITKKEGDEIPMEKSIIIKKTNQQPQAQKSKKSKGKNNKKKKSHLMIKQDGFEIIEPDFGNHSDHNNKLKYDEKSEDIINEATEDDTIIEESTENISDINECEIISNVDTVTVNEEINVVNELESLKEIQEEENIILKVLNVQASKKNDAIIDISDEEISNRTSIEIDLSFAQEIAEIEKEQVVEQECTEKNIEKSEKEVFDELSFFDNHKNIAELERDLMENLKILDDGIDIKSPIINPLFDFPITSAVQKWLQDKQNESFENLFRLENFKKLSELYDDCENEDDESDISDCPLKSDATDSDYASDIQVKGSPASSNAKIDTKITSRCNNKVIVKESFCALM